MTPTSTPDRVTRLLALVPYLTARPGTAVGLRRFATPLGGADDGDDRLELRTTEPGRLADQIAAYGADVVVEAPQSLRDAVITRLTRLAAMGETA